MHKDADKAKPTTSGTLVNVLDCTRHGLRGKKIGEALILIQGMYEDGELSTREEALSLLAEPEFLDSASM